MHEYKESGFLIARVVDIISSTTVTVHPGGRQFLYPRGSLQICEDIFV